MMCLLLLLLLVYLSIIVQDDDHPCVDVRCVVHGLIGHAPSDRTVANHRNAVVSGFTLEILSCGHTKCCTDGMMMGGCSWDGWLGWLGHDGERERTMMVVL